MDYWDTHWRLLQQSLKKNLKFSRNRTSCSLLESMKNFLIIWSNKSPGMMTVTTCGEWPDVNSIFPSDPIRRAKKSFNWSTILGSTSKGLLNLTPTPVRLIRYASLPWWSGSIFPLVVGNRIGHQVRIGWNKSTNRADVECSKVFRRSHQTWS